MLSLLLPGSSSALQCLLSLQAEHPLSFLGQASTLSSAPAVHSTVINLWPTNMILEKLQVNVPVGVAFVIKLPSSAPLL